MKYICNVYDKVKCEHCSGGEPHELSPGCMSDVMCGVINRIAKCVPCKNMNSEKSEWLEKWCDI
jgi:hypothetical protein